MSNKNYSALFEQKLPAFIRDDPAYSRFIEFFNAYYQWFDDTYDIYGFGDKLDIDSGYNDFVAYYAADFLPSFPDIDTIATDKIKLIKIVKELYKSKGIPDSFKFLFRALYNSPVQVNLTSEFILKPSDGKWIVPKSIKIKSLDPVFLNINNFKIFGELSKSIGIIEYSKINGKFTQIYISNIERTFNSAESIRILDYDNKDVYFLNGEYVRYDLTPPKGAVLLTSKIIGSISNIDITPTRRGKYYKVGDPIVISGGFNLDVEVPIGANGYVSEVTTGIIQKVRITNGGFGFRPFPNSEIQVITSDGNIDTNTNCIVSMVDTSHAANISYLSHDCIEPSLFTAIGSNNYNANNNIFVVSANANTTLQNCFSFLNYQTFPITAVTVLVSGTGYEQKPSLEFYSTFGTENSTGTVYRQEIQNLGILAPIEIVKSGYNYSISDTITISGGDGSLAFARISENGINIHGNITSVEYYYNTNFPYVLGGTSYTNENLPIITVNSSTGFGAELRVPGILGTGVEYEVETDKIGSITKISLSENGEDYISSPNVSLRIQDIIVTGNTVESIIPAACKVYQGNHTTPSFIANIDSVSTQFYNPETNYHTYRIRLYDYKGIINPSANLFVYGINTDFITTSMLTIDTTYSTSGTGGFKNGILIYGDGTAKATAKFLDGLIIDSGRYLNSDGQASAHSVLQSDEYNLSTYILSVEKDYDSYKDVVKNLLHPTGTRLISKNLLKSNVEFSVLSNTEIRIGNTLAEVRATLREYPGSCFSNTITIHSTEDIENIFSINDKISIAKDKDFSVYSTISNMNIIDKELYLTDSIRYKFSNVYSGYTVANTIIITNLNYPETQYNLNLLVIGDTVEIGNNTVTLTDKLNNTLYFINTLNASGNTLYAANVTIHKVLDSNNITFYTTV